MNKKKPVRFQKPIKYIDDSKHGLVFRVPANETGFKFVEDFRKYLNTHNYELSTRYTGKRVPSNAGHTLKENATSIRGYVKAKKKPKTKSLFKNARFSECLVEDTDVPNVTDVSDMYYALAIKDEEMERMQKELLALNNRVAEQVQWNLELQNKLDAKQNELKLEITAHTMMREERDKLKTELRYRDKLEWTDMTKDERDNPHGKTYELSVSDCECQGCPPKIGECDCRDSLPLIPEYNCHTEINKLKEERDELDKLCMSQHGIASEILKRRLPVINAEISKVLCNVVEFEIYLEVDDKSLDIMIRHPKYDPRPIELGSGAEKTLAAIAIRLALLNVSTLPRGDIFILDEPGTALDENNMEGFSRIVDMIKMQFSKVILISHLASLKDVADVTIAIDKKDGFAHINQ